MARRSKPSVLIFVVIILLTAVASYVRGNSGNTQTASPPAATQPTSVSEAANAKCHMHGLLPDPTCTPGAVDPNVTQANIDQTICITGYTKTVRPPVGYTDNLKAQQMAAYGFTDTIRQHEEDHLIPLEVGGSPADPHNLWPEPGNSPNPKDKVEDFLHAEVCSGRVSLQDAQKRIATDWTTAENGL